MAAGRTYDIIVYGATGFSGQLVASYLAEHADLYLRCAFAGRDETKLKNLQTKLAQIGNHIQFPYHVASSDNIDELRSLALMTRVLINCVGPFIKYGESVVQACVESKTHYVDINGEPSFIRLMIEKYHALAESNDVLIVPSAGFDSVPADMGVYAAGKKSKSRLVSAEVYVKHFDSISNGTYSTIIESLSNPPLKSSKPSASSSSSQKKRPRKIQKNVPFYNKQLKSWAIPFNFTSDPFIVTRSKKFEDDEEFAYAQYLYTDSFLVVVIFVFFAVIFFIALKLPNGPKLLRKLKDEGSGPSEEHRKNSTTEVYYFTKTESGESEETHYTGPEAYDATGVFASEAAITIVRDETSVVRRGVATTASALGDAYLKRLTQTGQIKFE